MTINIGREWKKLFYEWINQAKELVDTQLKSQSWRSLQKLDKEKMAKTHRGGQKCKIKHTSAL